MAIIKCKMCGGDIDISPDKTFGTCEYCGSTMTLPKVDDEQRAAAFNRGNHFRRSGEFDKALAVYERIVAEDDNDAEAHWCCALCRFGIEYVEDPATYEWLPTCHRASFDSFLEDVDYLAALEHSDGITRRQYQKDAAKIAEVQRGILATSQNEQPFDVFLCYKETGEDGQRTRDSLMAQEVYYELTEQGYRVFFARITLEDKAGAEYEPYIFAALNSAKVMVVIGTKPEHFNAVWVKNEWSRFLSMMKKDRSKLLLPCYRDMDPYDLPEALSVLQSYDMSKIGFMQDLIRGVKKVIDAGKPQEAAKETVKETVVVHNEGGSNVQALLKRGNMALEDGEWSKADEFFEQVLNQDAECGMAYLGKFLVRTQSRSAKACVDAFIGNAKVKVPSKKNAYACEEDTVFVSSCMEKYTVPGILSENEIRQMLKFDLGYCKTSDYYAEIAEKARMQLAADKDLMRAVKYVSSEAKTIMDGIPQTLDTLRRDAQQREKVECAAITANYRDFLTKTEAELEKEHPQRLKEAEDARKAEIFRRRKVKATAKKAGILAAIVAGIVTAAVLFTVNVILPPVNYSKAEKLLAAGDVKKAAISFGKCAGYQDARERSMSLWDTIADRKTLVANGTSIIALKIDGTAIGSSDINGDEADVSNWTDIVALSTGLAHTVGLTSNGTVVAVGLNLEGECDISDWTDIVAISAGTWSTFGLKANGTVVAIGSNEYGECDVSDWTDIVAINARTFRTVGLKADGTVVAVGWSNDGQCDVSDWTDIVAISTGDFHTVGLRANGTVVAVGDNEDGQCDVSDWTDIVAISAGYRHTVGLKADGTVVAVGNNDYDQCDVSDWTDIVAIDAGYFHTVGLKADGTVVAVDDNESGQCDVSGWKDIKLPN